MVVLRKYIQGRLRLAVFHIHEGKESGWNRKGRNGYNQKHTYYWQSEHSVFDSPQEEGAIISVILETKMERVIRVRSLKTDYAEAALTALGRKKEKELEEAGIIKSILFNAVCIAPSLENDKLGYFSPSGLLIVISEEVAENCDQNTLENIFLHELSHALDYSLHGTLSGHSVFFRECCRIIGVDTGFEKSHVQTGLKKENEKRERIRKLLALSTSPFANEAAEAMKKAKDLMARDGITLEKTENERIYMVPLYEGKRFPFSVRMLLSYISGLTGVYVVISQDGGKKAAIAYGSVEETETSIYLYDYLMSGAEKEIARLRNQGEHISKDSFLRGAISELTRKTEDTNSDNAIIAIRTENMKKTKRIVYPAVRLSRKMTRAHGGDASSYSKGVGFGSKLSVKTAIDRRELE